MNPGRFLVMSFSTVFLIKANDINFLALSLVDLGISGIKSQVQEMMA